MSPEIRVATSADADAINQMIIDLANFQKHGSDVRTSADVLRAQLSQENPPFECLIAEIDQKPVGFALFYRCYSTWEGNAGIYLEDLFVYPQARGYGVGKLLLSTLSEIAIARGCRRVDWMVQESNKLAQSFYSSFGARMIPEWTRWRFEPTPASSQPL